MADGAASDSEHIEAAGHFEAVAASYEHARPDYPAELYLELTRQEVIGDGMRVLEIGAGTGQATAELVRAGCLVTAVEPGTELARRLADRLPGATVVNARIELVDLPEAGFGSVVAAASMHWVDLAVALPRLHRALVPGGRLAVWRTVFGNPRVRTPLREAVARIVARHPEAGPRWDPLDPRPTVGELEQGDWFTHTSTWTHPWQVDLAPDEVTWLFATFSDWSAEELVELAGAAARLGPAIREHYVTHLHVLTAR